MKLAYIIFNQGHMSDVMDLLKKLDIDYFTRWERVTGKGHGTEAHIGTSVHPATNSLLMIAFEQEAILENLIDTIHEFNKEIIRPDDRVRLFQVPLDRIV